MRDIAADQDQTGNRSQHADEGNGNPIFQR